MVVLEVLVAGILLLIAVTMLLLGAAGYEGENFKVGKVAGVAPLLGFAIFVYFAFIMQW